MKNHRTYTINTSARTIRMIGALVNSNNALIIITRYVIDTRRLFTDHYQLMLSEDTCVCGR